MREGACEVSISYSCGRKYVMRQKHMDIIVPLETELRAHGGAIGCLPPLEA